MKAMLGVMLLLCVSGCAANTSTEMGLIARQQALIERQQHTIGQLLQVEQQQLHLIRSALLGTIPPSHSTIPSSNDHSL